MGVSFGGFPLDQPQLVWKRNCHFPSMGFCVMLVTVSEPTMNAHNPSSHLRGELENRRLKVEKN